MIPATSTRSAGSRVGKPRPGARCDLQIVQDYNRLSDAAAGLVAAAIRRRPSAVIGLPTGRTPLGVYRRLTAQRHRGLDTSRLTVVALDDYLGVGPDDPVSLFGWLRRTALTPLGIADSHVLRLPAEATEPLIACAAFDTWLSAIPSGVSAVRRLRQAAAAGRWLRPGHARLGVERARCP
jgi:hypothetical protein